MFFILIKNPCFLLQKNAPMIPINHPLLVKGKIPLKKNESSQYNPPLFNIDSKGAVAC